MATAANPNPTTVNHTPTSSAETGSLDVSQSSGRAAYPWTQIVRGTESESMTSQSPSGFPEQVAAAQSSSTSSSPSPEDPAMEAQQDGSDGSNNAGKKPAWNRPSNGAVEVVGPVMGAVTWPALSESTKASPKSASSESLKAVSDGSLSAPQGTGVASSSSQKQNITNNTNPNLTPNHVAPTRQKSMRRGGGGGGVSSSASATANGGLSGPVPPAPGSVAETPSNNAGKSDSVVLESSSRENTHKESGHKGNPGSQSHGGNDHAPQHRNSHRRGNGGGHPRGDGSYHHNYGGRHDQDRGNHDWNRSRSFNGREAHMHPHRGVSRGIMPPPQHNSTPFIPPHVPVRPYGGPMGYPDVPPPFFYVAGAPHEALRAMPIVAPIPPPHMFFPVPDPQLHSKIVNQIDYYFSYDNLIKDTFLRRNMDGQGWVPIKLIAGFKKVMLLTDNIQLILDALRTSTIVEVQGDKVRKRDDWMKWVITPVQFTTGVSSPPSFGRSSPDMLASGIQNFSLETKTAANHAEAFPGSSTS